MAYIPPFPPNLASQIYPLPYWTIYNELSFETEGKLEAERHYKKFEVRKGGTLHKLACSLFFQNKPPGWSIQKIVCIVNEHLLKRFETCAQLLEIEGETYKPEWNQLEPTALRARITKRWEDQVQQFQTKWPNQAKGPTTPYQHARFVPLWYHGNMSGGIETICSVGYTRPGRSGTADLFGHGFYFTNSATHAQRFAQNQRINSIVLNWCTMLPPFPVVSDGPSGKGYSCSDIRSLTDRGACQGANAHFVPMVDLNSPCNGEDPPICDEFVFFDRAQGLPFLTLELGVDFPISPTLQGLLHAAVKQNNLSAIERLSHSQALLCEIDEEGFTPIHLAIQSNKREACELLLKANKELVLEQRTKEESYTPLLVAAKSGFLELCQLLMTLGANMHARSLHGKTCLHLAVQSRNSQLVEFFSKDKELLDKEDQFQESPLKTAMRLKHPESCLSLLNAGAKIGFKISQDDLPFRENAVRLTHHDTDLLRELMFWAVSHGDYYLMKEISQFNHLYKERTPHGDTLLHLAALNGHWLAVDLLHLDPSATNHQGMNALHAAVVGGSSQVVTEILALSKDLILALDANKRTPLMLALELEKASAVEVLLLAQTSDLPPLSDSNILFLKNLFLQAAASGNERLVLRLLEFRFVVEARNENGETALIVAALAGCDRMCEILLKGGVDHAAVDRHGQNALHAAAKQSNGGVVKVLSTCTALLEQEDKIGDTPLEVAGKMKRIDPIESLLRLGACIRVANLLPLKSMIFHAIDWGNVYVVEKLLNHPKELLEVLDDNGYTPLLKACHLNKSKIFEMLLKAGGNTKARTKHKQNIIHLLSYGACNDYSRRNSLIEENPELVEERDSNGNIPLFISIGNDWFDLLMSKLIAATVNYRVRNNAGCNVLHIAASNKRWQAIWGFRYKGDYRTLLEERNDQGQTPRDIWPEGEWG